MEQNALKKLVGIEAAKYVVSGQTVGLGTGSTAKFLVEELARRIKEEGLRICGVTTSSETYQLAEKLGIPLKPIDEAGTIHVTIDGADEISPDFHGIKGGGGALLYEKIVAHYTTEKYIWIVDESKMVEHLGQFPLPIEVIPFGSEKLREELALAGYKPKFRLGRTGKEKFQTDAGNYILDLSLEKIEQPHLLADFLVKKVGVVEHGLFCEMVDVIIVGTKEGVQTIETNRKR